MTHRLAIIIPAYKATFLPAALDSIAMQTCKNFTLYVGDDCSPEPINNIVEKYRDKIELVYQRFETNLGGKDLVAQWERCIAMSQDEPKRFSMKSCAEAYFKAYQETGRLPRTNTSELLKRYNAMLVFLLLFFCYHTIL